MDEQQDTLVERVEKRIADGEPSPRTIVAEVLNVLADELPDHIGPNAQWAYRGWLRKRAEAVSEKRPAPPGVLADSWRWE